MRPHLAPVNRIAHLRTEKETLKGRISQAREKTRQGSSQEQHERQSRVAPRFAEGSRKVDAVKSEDAARARGASHVDEVVGASEKLIQEPCAGLAQWILAHRCQVGRNLAVEQPQLLELRMSESTQT